MEREAASQARVRREIVEDGILKNKMMKYHKNDASRILKLTSKNDRKQTSIHDLCMQSIQDKQTFIIGKYK